MLAADQVMRYPFEQFDARPVERFAALTGSQSTCLDGFVGSGAGRDVASRSTASVNSPSSMVRDASVGRLREMSELSSSHRADDAAHRPRTQCLAKWTGQGQAEGQTLRMRTRHSLPP